MSKPGGRYVCPNCTGKFPELDHGECPWCGQSADKSYEFESRTISHIQSDEEDDRRSGIFGSLFK